MAAPETPLAPTEISLHKKSRLLEIAFSDGEHFQLPCEYLRVLAAGDVLQDEPVHGKMRVNLVNIEPEGEVRVQLDFDDGFSARFSWQQIHELGVNYEQNWQAYLKTLEDRGLQRGSGRSAGADGKIKVKLLYFIQLAKISGKDDEEIELPESVANVEDLLGWLRNRGDDWHEAFADDRVQVTVNKQFAESFTLLEHADEVALVPRAQD